jgi:hypothetical protein
MNEQEEYTMTRYADTMTTWAPTSHEDVDRLDGRDVFAADGEKVGTVKAVYHPNTDFALARGKHYFLLDPGLLKSWFGGLDETYIPESAIAGYTGEGVYLNLTENQIKQHTWEAPADLASYRRA